MSSGRFGAAGGRGRASGSRLRRSTAGATRVPAVVAAAAASAPPGRRVVPRRTVAELVGDPVLLLVAGLLVVAGLAAVYAATRDPLISTGASGTRYLQRDGLNLVVALIAASLVPVVGHRRLAKLALPLFAVACLALVGVLTPLGNTVNGAKAWYAFGPVQVEPSQLAIFAFIILVAARLGQQPDPGAGRRMPRLPPLEVLGSAGAAVLVAVLILAEPALGMAAVLVVVAVGLLVLAGLRGRTLAASATAAAGVAVAAWRLGAVKPYQQHRLTAFLHPQLGDPAGYQVVQALTAVGSGGLTGKGFLLGTQTNGGFVPEQPTDFVFTVIAEETGFLGAALVLCLLAWLCLRALRISAAAVDGYATLLAGGLAVWFAVQTFINVAMAIGMMPVTGIPLPFVSYGGSALVVDLVAVGLLCSIARESAIRVQGESNDALWPPDALAGG